MAKSGRPNAPYAPLANVLAVLHRLRDRGISQPVTKESLTFIGIPEGNAPRTLQALKLLGLVAEDGLLQPAADRLRRATTDEYPGLLAEIIQEAYAPIFSILDPATATDVQISDAFRQYEPTNQWGRMVKLFVGLCEEAGIVPARVRTEGPGRSESVRARRVRPSRVTASAPPTTDQLGPIPTPFAQQTDLLFGAALDYLKDVPEDQIPAIWDALGVIAKARVQSLRALREMAQQAAERREKEATEEEQ